eukprot:TRINITY_DN6529_c0_g1_i1.p1 TRINITY_DN6529_c0_g1~~TRINITY_DN6529_c0_g1_i1.p1  ORF type:complete len:303 (+),score=66.24 TRINITY_DN6529_c0_g1_i1:348-1256(+)
MDLEIVTAFVMGGCEVDSKDDNGNTPLMYAAAQSREEIVEYLIQMGARAVLRNERGWTALHFAAMNGAAACCVYLLTHHAPVDAPSMDGLTPLHWAATHGHIDVTKHLLKHGAQIETKTTNGKTAFHLSVHYSHEECGLLLLSFGANWAELDSDGGSAIQECFERGCKRLIEDIVTRARSASDNVSAIVNIKIGKTPALIYSVNHGHEDLAIFLMMNGANPMEVSESGDTCLHAAVRAGSVHLATSFSQRYPQLIDLKNGEGKTPYDIAMALQRETMIEFLKVEVHTPSTPRDPKKNMKKKK